MGAGKGLNHLDKGGIDPFFLFFDFCQSKTTLDGALFFSRVRERGKKLGFFLGGWRGGDTFWEGIFS